MKVYLVGATSAVFLFLGCSDPAPVGATEASEAAASVEFEYGISEATIPALDAEAARDATLFVPEGTPASAELPLVVVLDGRAVRWIGPLLQGAIDEGSAPPVVLVGLHAANEPGSPPASPAEDLRALEYLHGYADWVKADGEIYDRHERFVTDDLLAWATGNLPVSREPNDTALMGFSNGASFALLTAARRPDLFGGAVVIALPWMGVLESLPDTAGESRLVLALGSDDEFSADVSQLAAKQLGLELQMFDGDHEWEAAGADLGAWLNAALGRQ